MFSASCGRLRQIFQWDSIYTSLYFPMLRRHFPNPPHYYAISGRRPPCQQREGNSSNCSLYFVIIFGAVQTFRLRAYFSVYFQLARSLPPAFPSTSRGTNFFPLHGLWEVGLWGMSRPSDTTLNSNAQYNKK